MPTKKNAIKKAATVRQKVGNKRTAHEETNTIKYAAQLPPIIEEQTQNDSRHLNLMNLTEEKYKQIMEIINRVEPSTQHSDYEHLTNTGLQKRNIEPSRPICINIKNIGRSEKRVELFKETFYDREVFITSEFEDTTYEEIMHLLRVSKYRLTGINLHQVTGEGIITLVYLKMCCISKNIFGDCSSKIIDFKETPGKIENEHSIVADDTYLQAATVIEFNLQAGDEISLSLFVQDISENLR